MTTSWPLRLCQTYRNFSSGSRTKMMSTRTYAEAVTSLNTLQTNFAIIDAIRKSGRKMNDQAIPEMQEWCRKIGYEPVELDRLNAIHIAGTKGKGSTAAFVSSILTQYIGVGSEDPVQRTPLSKVGLYTSPHLRFVRERIQINAEPLSEEQFAQYFFETWDRLEKSAVAAGEDPKAPSAKPVYFRFLTLMAFHTYISEGVDAAVIECGIGGAYDSTNIIEKPTVTAITSLGIDHTGVLGSTLEEIAWHKAGIMKPGVKCFTPGSQRPVAKAVLEKEAAEKRAELEYVDNAPGIISGEMQLGLQADFQKTNASLALAIAKEWLGKKGYSVANDSTDTKIRKGLQDVRWGGRCETRIENNITWCIDGGHTLDSIELAGKWYAQQVQKRSKNLECKHSRVLVFNQQTRDAGSLAKALHDTLVAAFGNGKPFTHAIFCTNTTFEKTGFRPDLMATNANAADVEEMKVQKQLARTWQGIDPSTDVKVVRTIEEAAESVRELATQGTEVTALVTGSLHLVGGFIEVIETKTMDRA